MNDSIAMRNYLNWLNADLPRETKQELRSYLTKPDEVISRFSDGLDFGTAGLRAVMELGTARMNEYSVAEAAMAIAQCVIEQGRAEQGIVISYDSRNNSRLYAETIARVTAEAGLRVYFSDEIRPVPMLSFAVRKYGAACGVMVTASHNPPKYNGIKVYGADGGQVRPETAARIKDHMGSTVHAFSMVKSSESLVQLIYDGHVTLIGSDLDSAYEEYLLDRLSAIHRAVPAEARENVRIIYTPLNGAGAKPVRRILATLGFKSVFVPPEQAEPDGDFPTLRVPNPEFPDTFDVAIKYAKMSMADVVIATDPDSDRLGVAVPNADGEYEVLTGNQIGILLMEYLLSKRPAADARRFFCVNSIVSSGLAERICMHHNVKLYRTLTGSKYVADLIERGGDTGTETFLFGFEEGHGYMFGAVEPDGDNESIAVRDKDAIFGAVLIAEMAALSKDQRLRLFDQFQSLYNFYGYGYEKTVAITREGLNGKTRIADYMAHFREDGPAVGDIPINKVTDYLPESNVLYYELGNKSDWVAIRPSGTEPKLKIYVGCYGTKAAAAERCEQIAAMLEQQIREIDSQQEQLGARPAAI